VSTKSFLVIKSKEKKRPEKKMKGFSRIKGLTDLHSSSSKRSVFSAKNKELINK